MGAEISVTNGAVGGMGSVFFRRCWPIVVPSDVDLMIIEFSANDPAEALVNIDVAMLIRSLLSQTSPPALLIVDIYSPRFSWYTAGVSINTLGEYFDIPVIR